MIKRLIDMTVAGGGVILLIPLLLALATAIKFHDGGPVFYRGTRVGRHGHLFRMFKLRTMVLHADVNGGPSTAEDDPRITPVGRVLRRYKLDELPQLFNVMSGEMSLVGPRPEVPQYVALFSPEER